MSAGIGNGVDASRSARSVTQPVTYLIAFEEIRLALVRCLQILATQCATQPPFKNFRSISERVCYHRSDALSAT